MKWVKATLSFANSNCVEVARARRRQVAVRDSKDPDGPVLLYSSGEWTAFLSDAKDGKFDLS